MSTELQYIEKVTKVKATTCSCDKCVNMCKTAVCTGTPLDIARLILAGHTDKLDSTLWRAGRKYGYNGSIDMIQLHFDEEKKQCCMLDENNLCTLHASGLKPIEGKMADCKIPYYTADQIPPLLIVARSWVVPENKPLIDLIELIFFADSFGFDLAKEMELLQAFVSGIDTVDISGEVKAKFCPET